MTIAEKYAWWLEKACEDPDLKTELDSVAGNDEEINDRFYRELDFGTAGLRGVIGAGDNRMNIYTVRKATQGLANYLNAHYTTSSVAIAFDSRIKSTLFAEESARVLAANGIHVYLFSELEPTPVLSFAVRELKCQSGIMVTASHNPAKYNGYKCYSPNGGQMTDEAADEVTAYIRKLNIFDDIRLIDFKDALAQGLIEYTAPAVLEKFLQAVATRQVNPGVCADADLKVVYTPLNGTGNKPVREILKRIGVAGVTVVPEQELPDGHFPTAPFPNPEIRQAFECALKLAHEVKPDLLLATDPDCDRVGIAVKDNDDYTLMTGNEVGCLLLNYILSCYKEQGILPENPVVVKTIVTSDLALRIAEEFGCTVVNVLTGFKYIGEQIDILQAQGHPERYILGFEESYGYLSGSHARDKDAVVASMLICEMAAYYKAKGLSLLQVLENLYQKHGVYAHSLINQVFEGAEGMKTMQRLMEQLRENRPTDFAGLKVTTFADYKESYQLDIASGEKSAITLPSSNVLSYGLEQNARVIVRPSGTEPKIKAYITATGATHEDAARMAQALKDAAAKLLKN